MIAVRVGTDHFTIDFLLHAISWTETAEWQEMIFWTSGREAPSIKMVPFVTGGVLEHWCCRVKLTHVDMQAVQLPCRRGLKICIPLTEYEQEV